MVQYTSQTWTVVNAGMDCTSLNSGDINVVGTYTLAQCENLCLWDTYMEFINPTSGSQTCKCGNSLVTNTCSAVTGANVYTRYATVTGVQTSTVVNEVVAGVPTNTCTPSVSDCSVQFTWSVTYGSMSIGFHDTIYGYNGGLVIVKQESGPSNGLFLMVNRYDTNMGYIPDGALVTFTFQPNGHYYTFVGGSMIGGVLTGATLVIDDCCQVQTSPLIPYVVFAPGTSGTFTSSTLPGISWTTIPFTTISIVTTGVAATTNQPGLVQWTYDFWALETGGVTCSQFEFGPFTGLTVAQCETVCRNDNFMDYSTSAGSCTCSAAGGTPCTASATNNLYGRTRFLTTGGTDVWTQVATNVNCVTNSNGAVAMSSAVTQTECNIACDAGGYNYYQAAGTSSITCTCLQEYNPVSDCVAASNSNVYTFSYKTGGVWSAYPGIQSRSSVTCTPAINGSCSVQFLWSEAYTSMSGLGFIDTITGVPYTVGMTKEANNTVVMVDNNGLVQALLLGGELITYTIANGFGYTLRGGTVVNGVLTGYSILGQIIIPNPAHPFSAFFNFGYVGAGPSISWVSVSAASLLPPQTSNSLDFTATDIGITVAGVLVVIAIIFGVGTYCSKKQHMKHSENVTQLAETQHLTATPAQQTNTIISIPNAMKK